MPTMSETKPQGRFAIWLATGLGVGLVSPAPGTMPVGATAGVGGGAAGDRQRSVTDDRADRLGQRGNLLGGSASVGWQQRSTVNCTRRNRRLADRLSGHHAHRPGGLVGWLATVSVVRHHQTIADLPFRATAWRLGNHGRRLGCCCCGVCCAAWVTLARSNCPVGNVCRRRLTTATDRVTIRNSAERAS